MEKLQKKSRKNSSPPGIEPGSLVISYRCAMKDKYANRYTMKSPVVKLVLVMCYVHEKYIS